MMSLCDSHYIYVYEEASPASQQSLLQSSVKDWNSNQLAKWRYGNSHYSFLQTSNNGIGYIMNRKGTMHKYTDMTNLYYGINFRR